MIAINDIMHDLLNKLRIISKIKEGQKLDTSKGLSIYSDSLLNWIIRKWYHDCKDEGIRFLRDLYKSFAQSIDSLISQSDHNKKANIQYIIINSAIELKNSIRGIENLAKTYSGYPTTTAALEGILRDYIIVTYTTLLDSIPDDKKPKELQQDILYMGNIIYKTSFADGNIDEL